MANPGPGFGLSFYLPTGARQASPPPRDSAYSEAVRAHGAGRPDMAEAACLRLVQERPDHAEAWNLLGVVSCQSGRMEEGLERYDRALALRPGYSDYLNNRGLALRGLGRPAEAEACFRQVLTQRPDYAGAWLNLSQTLQAMGRTKEAADSARRCLEHEPNQVDAWITLGVCLGEMGDKEEAVESYRRALALRPDHAGALNNLGNMLSELDRKDEAEACYEQAIQHGPNLAETYLNLAGILLGRRRPEQALAAYRRLLEKQPEHAEANFLAGNVCRDLGRLEEAVHYLQRALTANPGHAQARNNLGNIYKDQGRADLALEQYRQALRLDPDYAAAHNNLGILLNAMGQVAESIACYRRAIEIIPDYAPAHNNLGEALKDQGRLPEAVQSYRRALEIDATLELVHSNLLMCLNYDLSVDQAGILDEHLAWNRLHGQPRTARRRPHPNRPDPERPLRIGYVSGDFHRHPVGYFLFNALAHHDRGQFELFCYSDRNVEDDLTAQMKAQVKGWRLTDHMDDGDMEEMIRADGIDILVDLAGHTGKNRLAVFALKPAPVQVSWLGYFNTTGLDAMDYIIMDKHTVPPEQERWFVEKVAHLPHGRFCYAPPEYAPAVAPSPALARGKVTFGSFNKLTKVNPEVLGLWAAVLNQVPGSRLVLKWKTLNRSEDRQRFTALARQAGLDPRRLELRGESEHPKMLREYGDIDIALDPFPFCGALTSCEALWMGLPVVTFPGRRPVSRQTFAFLSELGLHELAARDTHHYVEIAKGLAGDLSRLAGLRASLRPRMAASPICDGQAFARDLEQAYRGMWQGWCGSDRGTSETHSNGK